ncbi:hypothetical protein RHMOL_Rhmol13G0030700 [Rhododendron molle]|uniref:Uncharacterized protein n=1 Tax=Rhododendron molle TaxID=49168 RepID=A0ACC0L303_RHOML|nr:hypothetical protein RHMOL_Rhmol13G0030700 [Rhododendron molle]
MGKNPVKYWLVDAFTDSAFKGNPAAVCLFEDERDDEWLQGVAAEFNVSQTAYLTRITDPDSETRDLTTNPRIEFLTRSGVLTAKRVPETKQTDSLENGEAQDCFMIELDFPVIPLTEFDSADLPSISKALNGASVIDLKKTTTDGDLFVVLPSGKIVADLQPQSDEIQKCPGRGVIVTGLAPSGSGFDFFSRFFVPKMGIKEDPVCGSAHCAIAAYWSKKLGKCDLVAYQVDAFTDSAFKGNPAAVCLLEDERDDQWLQSVAAEFNISETCYLTRITEPDSETRDSVPGFHLRWFTPVAEVKLCGHATLAASHYLFTSGLVNANKIEFLTLSGVLTAKRAPETGQMDSFIELDFPVVPLTEFDSAEIPAISKALNGASVIDLKETTTDENLLVVLPSGETVADLQPQIDEIRRCPGRGGVIVTGLAPSGSGFDFISRYFCPKWGINEDPVTGSVHCALAAYWSKKLGKCDFVAYQASPRGGILNLHLDENRQRVLLRGKAVTVMEAQICLKLSNHHMISHRNPIKTVFKFKRNLDMFKSKVQTELNLSKVQAELERCVDAFTDSAFKGNPAAVCLLEDDRDDEWLQGVAVEFNISDTAYLTRITDPDSETRESTTNPRFRLRWFTPVAEVNLCGHATLAASHFLFTSGLVNANKIEFPTQSGVLIAKRVPETKQTDSLNLENGEARDCFMIELDFPVIPLTEFDSAELPSISKALNGASVIDLKKTTTDGDLLVVLPSGKIVAELQPQSDEIQNCPGRGVIVTGLAPSGSGFDFFSRFFVPKLGIKEDPVTGSVHCALAAYWSKKLGKRDFVAYQASPRGGILNLHLDENRQRVLLWGKAVTVMEGSILV